MSRNALERMPALIAKHDQDAAEEILDSDENGSARFVWYDTKPGGKSNRGMTNPGQNTIGVRKKPGTKTQKASTLYHEWLHMRNVKGKDGPPTTAEEEAAPCAHAEIFEEQLLMLCELAACHASGTNTNPDLDWDDDDCKDFNEVCASWKNAAIRWSLIPYQIPETPTAIPVGWMPPMKPCTPEGC
jgi:hypothetical protein